MARDIQSTVRIFAIENGVTVESIAKATGMCTTSLFNKLSGRTEFKFSEAARLAEVLGIDLDELYGLWKVGR